MSLTCILIGQDNLLIQCGEILLKRSHQIKWVISPLKVIQGWCEKHNIAWVKSFDELPFEKICLVDYIFSIVNGKIFSREDLKIARLGVINYHDSLLPKYAGVNATTWAILNNEKSHGITWHMVNEGIDEGDIIYQISLPINDDETALSLNLRCFEAAIKGFLTVIRMLETSLLPIQKQNREQRSYYGINHALPNLGFIDWSHADAAQISLLSRALDMGGYKNSVGTLKLYLKNSFVIVENTQIAFHSIETKKSGLVLAIEKEGLLVSTLNHAVWMRKFLKPSGEIITVEALVQQYSLHVNYQLPHITESLIKSNIALFRSALDNETYWLKKLESIEEHNTFSNRLLSKDSDFVSLQAVNFLSREKSLFEYPYVYLMASVIIYLYRLNDYNNLKLFLCQSIIPSDINQDCGLFSSILPISFPLENEITGKQVLKVITEELALIAKHGSHMSDIFSRHPKKIGISYEDCLISISLSANEINFPSNSLIHFAIDKNLSKIDIHHRINCNYHGGVIDPLVVNMPAHLQNILNYIVSHPDERISQFSFLTEIEQTNLFGWGIGEYQSLPTNTILK